MTITRKKLIEVALPLEAINIASAREKSIRHGHPSTLHLWWARRPLAAARAVIWSQMVDDPSQYVEELLADPTNRRDAERSYRLRLKAWEERSAVFNKARSAGMTGASNPEPGGQPTLEDTAADMERQRLFAILEALVLWENTTNEAVLQPARDEIWKSWRRTCRDNADDPRAKELYDPTKLPAFHDPFAGGGALPLEAQRLGLESYASDLNPVAVLINKAMIEIPPKFAGHPPVNPEVRQEKRLLAQTWQGAQGLAEDVRYYGRWIRDQAEKRIGHLYPKVEVTMDMITERPDLKPYIGQELTVIAWLWTRTVKSPNPAFANVDVPLASTFMLSNKKGKESYVEPIIKKGSYQFIVKTGKPKDVDEVRKGTKLARANFICLMSGVAISGDYLKVEGKAGRMGTRLLAVVVEGEKERVYLSPTDAMESIAYQAKPKWEPEGDLVKDARAFTPILYGLTAWRDLFTSRQLVALTNFSDLVKEVREIVLRDALDAGQPNDTTQFAHGGGGVVAYADALAVYLGIAVSRMSSYWSNMTTHDTSREKITSVFARQAIAMVWDFMEGNPFSNTSGNFLNSIEASGKVLDHLISGMGSGLVYQYDATHQTISHDKIISTDPPYYDNVPYADLSDFFYVWLRHSLKFILPDLFSTLAVPKTEELVAFAYRHKSKLDAESFFLNGMTHAISCLAQGSHPLFPVTIYYAFKQAETDISEGIASTGWETFLDAVIRSGFVITGTWPIRTEMKGRVRDRGESNALASSIVLVCREQTSDALTATRREFVGALNNELPLALAHMQAGNIAPVDLAQAAIGPGMAVYTRYAKVLDAQGRPLTVRNALALINESLDEALAEQEGDFDADTRWALAWFEQSGFAEGEFGVADVLARAKDTSISGMVEAGILASGHGKVRLLKPAELPKDWDPNTDKRLTAWEMVHQLIRVLEKDGEGGAAQLMAKLGARAETARELCYRLYTLCERKKRAAEALSYNALVQSWPEAARLARETSAVQYTQRTMFVEGEG